MHYVYFLRSVKEGYEGRSYVGRTENIQQRLQQHNQGLSPSTKPYTPWILEAVVKADTLETAIIAESYFKSSAGKEKFTDYKKANPHSINPIADFFNTERHEGLGLGRNPNRFYFTDCKPTILTMDKSKAKKFVKKD
ncbi:MAG: hypothetical protein GC136_07630 [Alphaproteobacteria bacterium]|nr:hypothetical protein [Alphaproteobacteria bacterium]